MTKRIDIPNVKRKITIEALLRWAYRDELPKERAGGGLFLPAGFGGAWGGVERFGETLTVVDGGPENRYGLAVDFTAVAGAHLDAVRVGDAVNRLDGFLMVLPEDWNPLADWPGLGVEGAAAIQRAVERETYIDGNGDRRFKTAISRLIVRHALMNDSPVWEGEEPQVKTVCGPNGQPRWFRRVQVVADPGDEELGIMPTYTEIEVDGMNAKRRRPHTDAYRKTYLDPDPAEVIVSRAEYELWCAALDLLAIDLEGVLDAHEIVPSHRPARPWEGGVVARRRVLDSNASPAAWLTLWNGVWGGVKPA